MDIGPTAAYIRRMNSEKNSHGPIPQQEHILTIDVEDWYLSHLEFFPDSPASPDDRTDLSIVHSVRKVLDLLEHTHNTATFFVLGTVARDYPDIIGEIAAHGHEIASHGYRHRRLVHLTPAEFARDLDLSLEALDKAGAANIKGYRAPCFSITRQTMWALELIKQSGLVYDASIFPIRRRLYGIPDWPVEPTQLPNGLWEFPPATVRVAGQNLAVAGGGWLRMLPYGLIRRAWRSRRLSTPAVFYFHPYELDPSSVRLRHQPKKLYTRAVAALETIGLQSNPAKIRRLLKEFRFRRLDAYLPQ
jgi:polysaccharide deacetylase family protein (PEP-CTERM system associated)